MIGDVLGGKTRDDGVLEMGDPNGKCQHCGEGFKADASESGQVIWWRPRTDCCITIVTRQLNWATKWLKEYQDLERARRERWAASKTKRFNEAKTDEQRERIEREKYRPDEALQDEIEGQQLALAQSKKALASLKKAPLYHEVTR